MTRHPHLRHLALHGALAALLATGFTACGTARPDREPDAEPIAGLAPATWTWVPFAGTACQDGSPTGLAVSAGTGPDLVLFLNGGGACWDYLTCEVLSLATPGPFGEAQFQALRADVLPGSILDRDLPGNPFADATLVFVPYCTGDVHAGDRAATYTGAGGPVTYLHVGRSNLEAFLRRLAATWPSPRRLVVSGASAGGFGALLDYDAVRRRWPAARGFLVDDSGPPLGEGAIRPDLLAAWREAWGIDPLLEPLCGAACETAFGPVLAAVAARWPEDRLALLSSLRDSVISGYFQLPEADFEGYLRAMASELVAPLPNARVYLVPGEQHTMLGVPGNFTQGVPLLDWLSAQVGGDPAWDSQLPPEAP